MTKLEALEALKAKVEAGIAGYSIFHDSCQILKGFHGRAFEAYKDGSLDAAMALHNAVPTPRAIMSPEDMAIVLFGNNGARHFLIWKLSALIEQEKDSAA